VIEINEEGGAAVVDVTPPLVPPSDPGEGRVRVRRTRLLEEKNDGETV